MNKKQIIITISVVTVLLIGGGTTAYVLSNNKDDKKKDEKVELTTNSNKKTKDIPKSSIDKDIKSSEIDEETKSTNNDITKDSEKTSNSTVVTDDHKGNADDYKGTNEFHKDGYTFTDDGDVEVKNKETNNEKVVIQKSDIDSDRQALNDAGLPGDAYSDSDIASLRILANNESIDIVTAANIPK